MFRFKLFHVTIVEEHQHLLTEEMPKIKKKILPFNTFGMVHLILHVISLPYRDKIAGILSELVLHKLKCFNCLAQFAAKWSMINSLKPVNLHKLKNLHNKSKANVILLDFISLAILFNKRSMHT